MLEKPFQGLNPGNEVWNLAGRKEKVVLLGVRKLGMVLPFTVRSPVKQGSLNWIMLLNHTLYKKPLELGRFPKGLSYPKSRGTVARVLGPAAQVWENSLSGDIPRARDDCQWHDIGSWGQKVF